MIQEVTGSSPVRYPNDPVAQWIERESTKLEVSRSTWLRITGFAPVCRLSSKQEKANGYMQVRVLSGVPVYPLCENTRGIGRMFGGH